MVELSNIAEEFLDEILEILWVKLEEGGMESVSLGEIVVGSVPVYEEPIKVLENKGLVKERLEALKREISKRWKQSDNGYRLAIETEIFWRRGAPVVGAK